MRPFPAVLVPLLLAPIAGFAADSLSTENVLVVANDGSTLSRRIAEYYIQQRGIPLRNYCHIKTAEVEVIERSVYTSEVEKGIRTCLARRSDPVLAIVLTQGVPLRIKTQRGSREGVDGASVDSELTLLYSKIHGVSNPLPGSLSNPYFGKRDTPFQQQQFPMFLVARLAAQSFDHVKRMIDHSVAVSRNPGPSAAGKVVLDLKGFDDSMGNDWLRNAAIALPQSVVILDETTKVIANEKDVIGYASWGSNDKARKDRHTGFSWLPGSVATAFVSTDGRTFAAPPDGWNIGAWTDKDRYFVGSPQSLCSDYLAEGASAVTCHVDEPFLSMTPRPDYLLPAYLVKHRTLAESFYSSIPALSWQNILVGDPLMSLRSTQ